MKTSEIRKMSTEEINAKITEIKDELFDLRMKQSNGTLLETHKIHELRKTIARLKTILNESCEAFLRTGVSAKSPACAIFNRPKRKFSFEIF